MTRCQTIRVAFRSAKGRSFAERKTTLPASYYLTTPYAIHLSQTTHSRHPRTRSRPTADTPIRLTPETLSASERSVETSTVRHRAANSTSFPYRRVFRHRHPHPPNTNHRRSIHLQRRQSRSPDRRQAHDLGTVPAPGKVFASCLLLRMKQGHVGVGQRIDCRRTGCFVSIAHRAREAHVAECRFTADRPRPDVLKFKSGRGQPLGSLAIHAVATKTLAHQTLERHGDVDTPDPSASTFSCVRV